MTANNQNNPRFIIIHCSAVSRQNSFYQFDAINAYHKSGHPDAPFPLSSLGYYGGYDLLIEPDGKERRYRTDLEEGSHCNQVLDGVSMNFQSLGVCLSGDFDIEMPTPAQIATLKARIQTWMDAYKIPLQNIYLHRHFATWKTCAGSLLPDNWGQLLAQPEVPDAEKIRKQEEIQKKIIEIQGMIARLRDAIARYLHR